MPVCAEDRRSGKKPVGFTLPNDPCFKKWRCIYKTMDFRNSFGFSHCVELFPVQQWWQSLGSISFSKPESKWNSTDYLCTRFRLTTSEGRKCRRKNMLPGRRCRFVLKCGLAREDSLLYTPLFISANRTGQKNGDTKCEDLRQTHKAQLMQHVFGLRPVSALVCSMPEEICVTIKTCPHGPTLYPRLTSAATLTQLPTPVH